MRILFILSAFVLTASSGILAQKPERVRDGYLGAVKRVVTQRADLKKRIGSNIKPRLRLESDITYSKDGSRLRELSYEFTEGLLRDISVYKVIDGKRVLAFEEGDTPGRIVARVPETTKDEKPWDPRFAYSFEYKFDQNGNVLEEVWRQSNGELWLKYVYSYNGDQKEELVYDSDGKLNQKYLYKLDDKGRVIEQIIFDADNGSRLERITYEYVEFDKTGNWTRRRESAGDKEGKFVLRPREMQYRKLTYH